MRVETDPDRVAELGQQREDANWAFRSFLKQSDIPSSRIDASVHALYRDCRSFPHLHKRDFVFRLIQAVENCALCPIVFGVYEGLKRQWWHGHDR